MTAVDGAVKSGEAVADWLRSRIASGELVAGDRLPPEDELMASLGIARTTLRQGLRILESRGLIEVQRGRNGGGRVIAPRIDRLARDFAVHLQLQQTTMGDLDEARRLIEPPAAGRLAQIRTDADLAVLGAAVDDAATAAGAGDVMAFALAATRVHETIMERSGNVTLATVSRLLHELVQDYYVWGAMKSDRKVIERAVRSYRKLYSLVIAGDAAGAEAHWQRQMAFMVVAGGRDEPLDAFTPS